MSADWKAAIRNDRAAKDEHFRTDPHSPIPSDERDGFDGLAYYPIDGSHRFELDADEYDDKEPVTVGTSTGGEKAYGGNDADH
jgi:uncharacterized protein (DUF1684 family)